MEGRFENLRWAARQVARLRNRNRLHIETRSETFHIGLRYIREVLCDEVRFLALAPSERHSLRRHRLPNSQTEMAQELPRESKFVASHERYHAGVISFCDFIHNPIDPSLLRKVQNDDQFREES